MYRQADRQVDPVIILGGQIWLMRPKKHKYKVYSFLKKRMVDTTMIKGLQAYDSSRLGLSNLYYKIQIKI